MLSPVLAGLGLGFSLIIAIGAQNLFVLRQGLRREHVLAVAAVCAISDAVLIALGVSGVGLVLQAVPWLVVVVRWAGALFLVAYGLLAARRAWRPSGQTLGGEATGPGSSAHDAHESVPPGRTHAGEALEAGASASAVRSDVRTAATPAAHARLLPVLLTCLALTWLNPHVYLDTVFLLGTVANTHGDSRWLFAAGAMTASVVWFFGLAFGARLLGRWLSTPRAWRILDAVIAVVMIALGVSLVLPH
ncbi:amino acid transporter [Microbacterium trichothecenolyticum]|uniref:L-lysine exporter n=1 Tax=Microbacterium trichothecenolyticum TaxID=69370 RepID=UPI001C6DF1FC|nr:L-lysine exporter [Microbacterium trichothecenolyticum]MBW9121385.1 amino acid transporter [Microbacterium trichothecenolyticum]